MFYVIMLKTETVYKLLYLGGSPFDATVIMSENRGATIDIVESEAAAHTLFNERNEQVLQAQSVGFEFEVGSADFLQDMQDLKDLGLETVGNIASFGLSQLEAMEKTLDLKQGVGTFLENITAGGAEALDKANAYKVRGSHVIGEVFLQIGTFFKKP